MASITTDKNDTLCFEIDGLQEILHWLLSWAGRVRVKEPEELRELFPECSQSCRRDELFAAISAASTHSPGPRQSLC
jgi:hypothetical protein